LRTLAAIPILTRSSFTPETPGSLKSAVRELVGRQSNFRVFVHAALVGAVVDRDAPDTG
jgi:hypothetical protein